MTQADARNRQNTFTPLLRYCHVNISFTSTESCCSFEGKMQIRPHDYESISKDTCRFSMTQCVCRVSASPYSLPQIQTEYRDLQHHAAFAHFLRSD